MGTVTLASVYLPNHGQLTYLEDILIILQTFMEEAVIPGGDLNIALDPLLDTGPSLIFPTPTSESKRLCRLSDWLMRGGFLCPNVRDYTFYSPPP